MCMRLNSLVSNLPAEHIIIYELRVLKNRTPIHSATICTEQQNTLATVGKSDFFFVHSSTSIFRITQQQQHVFNFPIKILSWHDRHKCTNLYVLWNNVQGFGYVLTSNTISASCIDFIVL